MAKNRIIYQKQPKVFEATASFVIVVFAIAFTFLYDDYFSKLMVFGSFVLFLIIQTISNYYSNGIIIYQNRIEVKKRKWNGKLESKLYDFEHILSIRYNSGGYKQQCAIYLTTRHKKNIKVPTPESSFKFGHVLRFLCENGIPIKLVHTDHELRLYIDGKISEYPKKNRKR